MVRPALKIFSFAVTRPTALRSCRSKNFWVGRQENATKILLEVECFRPTVGSPIRQLFFLVHSGNSDLWEVNFHPGKVNREVEEPMFDWYRKKILTLFFRIGSYSDRFHSRNLKSRCFRGNIGLSVEIRSRSARKCSAKYICIIMLRQPVITATKHSSKFKTSLP